MERKVFLICLAKKSTAAVASLSLLSSCSSLTQFACHCGRSHSCCVSLKFVITFTTIPGSFKLFFIAKNVLHIFIYRQTTKLYGTLMSGASVKNCHVWCFTDRQINRSQIDDQLLPLPPVVTAVARTPLPPLLGEQTHYKGVPKEVLIKNTFF